MPRNLGNSAFMRPFVILALPGMYLFYKYNQYKQQQREQTRRKVTERELAHLNHKIDKLLMKLEENEPELATSQDDECVICVNAKATMQTSPCGHRVVCRKCFVKTIQMAVSQRLLPLRCVICRAKILRLKQNISSPVGCPKSWMGASSSYSVSRRSYSAPTGKAPWGDKSWVASSASQYAMANNSNNNNNNNNNNGNNKSVRNSASTYSMTSGASTLSGVSSVSSGTSSSAGRKAPVAKGGAVSRVGTVRQPTGSLRKSQQYAMKARIQEFNEPARPARPAAQPEKTARLPPIVEFQREYRLGKELASASTRIRCAQKIVTQLSTTPRKTGRTGRRPVMAAAAAAAAAGPAQDPTPSTSASASNSYYKSPMKPAIKDEKKRDKSEEGKATKPKEEPAKKPEKAENGEVKKKEVRFETDKKEPEKKEEAGKVDKKDVKPEKKPVSKEVKNEKTDPKVEKGKN